MIDGVQKTYSTSAVIFRLNVIVRPIQIKLGKIQRTYITTAGSPFNSSFQKQSKTIIIIIKKCCLVVTPSAVMSYCGSRQ